MTLTGQIAIFLAAAVVAVPLFRRFKLSAVLGYLAAGAVIGPWGLRLVTDVEGILHFSELGVVMLLFAIGLELQPSRLWVLRNAVFGAGFAQVVVTTALLAGIAHLFGQPWPAAAVIGFALSLSSTALILQVLAERNELSTRHGRAAFAILLFQDLAIIPTLIALPLIAGYSSAALEPRSIALQVGVFALVAGLGRHALRPFLRVIANTRVQETFTAAALLVVLGTAVLFEAAGLSMALGAFLAGVLLADSEYRHELEADIEPFKGLLLGLFFIAVGMTANLGELMEAPLELAGLTAGFVAVKGLAVWFAARLARYEHSMAWRLGAALAGGGEFAFVLLAIAARDRIIDAEMADRLVIVVTLSMIAAPLVIALADRVARRMRGRPAPAAYDRIESDEPRVLVAGFGRFGQVVGRVLRARHIRFTALEISQAQVDFLRRFGNKLYYGDASRLDMLRAAGADRAELLVLAIDDVDASVRTAELVLHNFPKLRILARARNRQHTFRLMDAGVDHIWREMLGSSLEMAESALVELGTDPQTAAAYIRTFRAHDQATLLAQAAVKDDEAKLIASTAAAARQLESLFEADVR